MPQAYTRTQVIDLGYASAALSPVTIHFLVLSRPFPPYSLLNEKEKKGQWGFIDEQSPAGEVFRTEILNELRKMLCPNSLIILPEFAGGPLLTDSIRDLLVESDKRSCFVVGGSYYAERAGKIASICPIIAPDGHIYEQFKIDPADAERRDGCDPHHDKPLLVFRRSGFGNFAVVICSDALTARIDSISINLRADQVHLLVIPARNRSSDLPNQLRTLSATQGILVAYCNGLEGREKIDACVYTPLKSGSEIPDADRKIPDADGRCTIDLCEVYDRCKADAKSAQRTWGFPPRWAAWPMTSPIVFQRCPNVLAIGSHFDDIWLGCAATLMLLSEVYEGRIVCSDICDHYPEKYFGKYKIDEGVHKRVNALCAALDFWKYDRDWDEGEQGTLIDRKFPSQLEILSRRVKYLSDRYRDADFVFVPRHDDHHEDHVLTTKEVLKEFRRSMVLEYEIKEFRRGPFHPSVLVDVSARSHKDLTWVDHTYRDFTTVSQAEKVDPKSFAAKKALILQEIFPKILCDADAELPVTFSREYVLGRMAMRAEEFGLDRTYAEAFATDQIVGR